MESLIKNLEGKGVYISNITYDCPTKKKHLPYGEFDDPLSILGLSKGLLLTTGAAIYALGPNDNGCKTQENGYEDLKDPDLELLLTTERRLSDICKVEFDIVVTGDSLEFKYVFGSDEYLEFPSYHDVFGFFISGPGISGVQNLATIFNPITNQISPVNVNTINTNSNSQFYINNGTGATPFYNMDLQYDGYTTVLKARSKVIPCETYHIKLAIADVKDATCDAGVFIEANSFKTNEPSIKYVLYEHPEYNSAIEGCNKAYVVFERGNTDLTKDIDIDYLVKGTAIMGIDYNSLSSKVTIPAGRDTAFIVIDPFIDNENDDEETVIIVIPAKCPNQQDFDSIEVIIKEKFIYKINNETICPGEKVSLNLNYKDRDSIIWNSDKYLSCKTCPSPLTSPEISHWFTYQVIDKITTCTAFDSVFVKVLPNPIADFSYFQDDGLLPSDIYFQNLSHHSNSYKWNFGDGTSATDQNPLHSFPDNISLQSVYYNVQLISKQEGHICADTIMKTIEIAPFFIPNLITRNNDNLNDEFHVIGIKPGFWNLNIYDRWGGLVYKHNGYDNRWKPTNVSTGVYFFHLMNIYKNRDFKGWLHVVE